MIRKVKLGEICDILNGYAFKSKEYVEDGIRIIRITNVQKGIIQDTDPKYYQIDKIETLKNYMLKENDLLISLTGNVGRVGQISKDLLPAGLNQRVGCIRIKEKEDVSIDYLYQYFNSYNFERDCINNSKGIAQKNLSTEWLKNYKMKIPSLDEQKRIAIELRQIQRIKDLKQQQLKELNQLIKSQFVEMFKKIKRYVELQKVCLFINGDRGENYPSGDKISKNKDGVAFINAGLLESNKVKWSNMNYISEDTYNNLRSGKIQKDDILYCLRGSLGKCAIIDFSERGAIASSLVILRANKNEINPNFLLIQLGMEEILYQQNQANNGSSQPNLSANSVKKYKILLPPITLQNQFSEIVKQIDKQKFEIEKSLKETQELYESLMEKYFG